MLKSVNLWKTLEKSNKEKRIPAVGKGCLKLLKLCHRLHTSGVSDLKVKKNLPNIAIKFVGKRMD